VAQQDCHTERAVRHSALTEDTCMPEGSGVESETRSRASSSGNLADCMSKGESSQLLQPPWDWCLGALILKMNAFQEELLMQSEEISLDV
ncbi:hypothetical protein P7K49_001000, partial [Saguinus oedipus]